VGSGGQYTVTAEDNCKTRVLLVHRPQASAFFHAPQAEAFTCLHKTSAAHLRSSEIELAPKQER
jgi:hypothetical protein